MGMLEKFCGWCAGIAFRLQRVTCPNPWGIREPPPVSRSPTYLAHLTRRDSGEQIPQVSAIMLLISANVHGASLKPSELI